MPKSGTLSNFVLIRWVLKFGQKYRFFKVVFVGIFREEKKYPKLVILHSFIAIRPQQVQVMRMNLLKCSNEYGEKITTSQI